MDEAREGAEWSGEAAPAAAAGEVEAVGSSVEKVGESRRAGELFDEGLIDRLAERIAERLRGDFARDSRELLDANEVARILGCKRSWVYEHQAELPLVRLGKGPKPRLRFDRAKVEALAAVEPAPQDTAPSPPRRRARRRYRRQPEVKLLEIKGRVR